MMFLKKSLSIILLVVLPVCFSFGQDTSNNNNSFELVKNLDIYATLFKELNTNYVDEINPGELTKTAIDAMLESLDPYTNYIPESEVEDYKFITTGEYGGIGALIHQQGEYVVISEPYEGSPAQKSGLMAGDKVLEINGQSAKGKTYSDVSAILKGQAGTPITIKILRDGEENPIEKTITREVIHIDNIPYSGILDDNIGYIRLTSFTQNAASEFRKAFLKLKEQTTLKGLIIDIRGNGGGLLTEAVDITNLFVDKGQDVVTTKGKLADKNHTYKTTVQAVDPSLPIVVLVDGQSASASEILSGALQDLDRAVIIGHRTFGKGLVQNVLPLSFNAQMKVTVAKYYIPSGRCIQAIDYSHKDKQGNFEKIPDSLITAFKTHNGRTVYEGRGIAPDVTTPIVHFSNIAMALYSKYLIFDFATIFRRTHPSILPADKFEITDSIFDSFKKYISDKNYDYKTLSEVTLETLKKNAEKEKYYDSMKPEFEALQAKMSEDKKSDLIKHQDQIRELLKQEIVTRYYYQKGKVASSMKNDPDIAVAIKTLNDTATFSSILKGTFVSPKPESDDSSDEEDTDTGSDETN
ncbi:MAG: S41 family peptidase [Bacteroidota bacterium]|nr:S41 family peptidase [Bacteroidota bacterium]